MSAITDERLAWLCDCAVEPGRDDPGNLGLIGQLAREIRHLRATTFDQTINAWGYRTFGDPQPDRAGICAAFARLHSEFDELMDAINAGLPSGRVTAEIGDVRICLARLADLYKVDVEEVARAKHEVNLRRAWHQYGNGHGQHCRRYGHPGSIVPCRGCEAGLPLVLPEIVDL